MRRAVITILGIALLGLAPTSSWADLATYNQDLEGLTPAPQSLPATSLGVDGWLLWVNVWDAFGGYLYNYGSVFPAPNTGEAISAVVEDQGGPPQGVQQMSVFSDYNNGDHAACGPGPDEFDSSSPTCRFIEVNVYQEQVIGAADLGTTWRFEFDAKRGNIEGATTAQAFLKVINPFAGYSLTHIVPVDMTGASTTWGRESLQIYIEPDWGGQLLQFGFLNKATAYEGSGIFYDNINFDLAPLSANIDIKPGSDPNSINPFDRGLIPVAILGSAVFDVSNIDVTTLRFGPAQIPTRHDLTDDWDYNEHLSDVNFDGFTDLVTHYTTQDTGIACGDIQAVLSGALLDGTPFDGSDAVRTVGCYSNRPMPTLKRRGTERRIRSDLTEEQRVD